MTPPLAAAAAEPNRFQRGLFIAVFVIVVVGILFWLRRRGDAARWRQRRARVFADVREVEQDCGGVLTAPGPGAAASVWSGLEPRAVVCATELADLARSGQNPAQASEVARVREALVQLTDELRQLMARLRADPTAAGTTGQGAYGSSDANGTSGAEAARRALREALPAPTR